ncbi:MAG TPA: NAD(P)-binding domain-containing protein, partial [Candidatus Limnocylindrales bacterium]|nr:NAD(P)-binding domain-containing protein [Candidatus Limnocylindrales bacterium]
MTEPAITDRAVGIIGLGYVGLPLAVAFADAGRDVIGLDVSGAKVDAIMAGHSYIEDVAAADVSRLVR